MIPTHCSFEAWPALRKKLGLRIVGGGGMEQWPPVILVEQDGKEDQQMPEQKPKSKLAFVLEQLHRAAELHPGKIQEHILKSGLTIKLNCEIDGTTRLLLAREGVYPSDTEWATVMAHFPYDPPLEVEPEKCEGKNMFGLRAKWETPAKEEA